MHPVPTRAKLSPAASSKSAPLRPYLIASAASKPKRHSILVLWHLCSLDAPTVAATWVAFITWSAGIRVSLLDPLAMFLAVWMLYVADRLLDAKPLFTTPSAADLEERHLFHHRFRHTFLTGIGVVVLPLLVLLHHTNDAVLHLYVLLGSLLCVWLLFVHARPAPSTASHRLPKELAVGIFFPAAVFIPTVARAPWFRLALVPAALCFAALCSLNCLFLYAWEHPLHRGHAHASTRWAVRHLKLLAWSAALLAAALCLAATLVPANWISPWHHLTHASAPLLACILSCTLLLALHATRRRLSPVTLRALADAVLLTPLLITLFAVLARDR